MTEIEPRFSDALHTIAAVDSALCADPRADAVRSAIAGPLSAALVMVASQLSTQPKLLERMGADEIRSYYELRVAQLVVAPEERRLEIFDGIEQELQEVLRLDSKKAREAGGRLVGCLLVALEELPRQAVDRLLGLLGSLTRRFEGIAAQTPPLFEPSSPTRHRLSQLLEVGLFSEALCFVAGMRDLEMPALPNSTTLPSSVVAITSRKGGVGKSTLALAVALSHLTRPNPTDLCILDLDITGPVWQYLVSPDRRPSLPHLNAMIDFDQPETRFNFGTPTPQDVQRCVGRMSLPVQDRLTGEIADREIGLVTFADLPRTNRYLMQVIANNRLSFTKFLMSVVQGLAPRYPLVIVDHSPGFDTHVLISLSIASATRDGCPVVVSTSHAADLVGTSLELSDLKLLGWKSTPLWIVNKADSEAYDFFGRSHTLAEIAERFPGYSEIMPNTPLLKLVLSAKPVTLMPLLFDGMLARRGIIDFARANSKDAIIDFLRTGWFQVFETDVLPRFVRQSGFRT